jgi:hypothetical protein
MACERACGACERGGHGAPKSPRAACEQGQGRALGIFQAAGRRGAGGGDGQHKPSARADEREPQHQRAGV